MTKAKAVRIVKQQDTVNRSVRVVGTKDIMFDRYAGDNDTKLEPWQKLYLEVGNSKVIGLPAGNIQSSLTAHNTNSFPKRLLDKRKFKDFCNACLSFVEISPNFIPFKRDGKPIVFGRFEGDVDPSSGCYIHRSVARLDKGIPNPKVRPVLPLPWTLEFKLTILPNTEFQEDQLMNLFEAGGRAVGFGTFRGLFGKFVVEAWE